MEWQKVESLTKPEKFDFTSSKKYNYIHRNIEEKKRYDDNNNLLTFYEFEEVKVDKQIWQLYLEVEQSRANIDYLTMIILQGDENDELVQ